MLNLDQIKKFDYELVDSQIRVNINPLNTYKNSSVVNNRGDSDILSEVSYDFRLN